MRAVIIVALAALLPLSFGGTAHADAVSTKVFACTVGAKTVSVMVSGGQLVYRYGTAEKEEMSIVGVPALGNVFQLAQRFAGMEYQLRFKSGEFSYIVYESEGNDRVGAAGTSGLIVMRGTKTISNKPCARFTELVMPEEALKIPEDTDTYSAM